MSAMNQYALLLVVQGMECQSGGDIQVFNVEVFREKWAKGISHISYQMKCKEGLCKDYSGFYLRGGLSYQLTSDRNIQFYYHNGNDIHKSTIIKQYGSQKWTVSQLDISELDPIIEYK